jgi:hypothetical protein
MGTKTAKAPLSETAARFQRRPQLQPFSARQIEPRIDDFGSFWKLWRLCRWESSRLPFSFSRFVEDFGLRTCILEIEGSCFDHLHQHLPNLAVLSGQHQVLKRRSAQVHFLRCRVSSLRARHGAKPRRWQTGSSFISGDNETSKLPPRDGMSQLFAVLTSNLIGQPKKQWATHALSSKRRQARAASL